MADELKQVNKDIQKLEADLKQKASKNSPEFQKIFNKELQAGRSVADAFETATTERKAQISEQKTVTCPSCGSANKVKQKAGGKYLFNITFPFTKITLRIPNPAGFFGKVVTFDENLKDGEKCKACQGQKEIPDVTDDSAKYQQAQQTIEQNAPALMETEAKLGPGGTRTTYIQGSDMLYVGLGFNHNASTEIVPGGSIAPKTATETKSPQKGGAPANAAVGKQSELGWPQSVGNFFIKCANKFNVLAGGGGITLATKGPLTLSGGTIRFSGPSMTLGSNDGPLTLEGDSVTVSGKHVTISPSGGEAHVTGSLTCDGNAVVSGHLHTEGISFTRASCPGIDKPTTFDQAFKDGTKTQAAEWSFKAAASAAIELQTLLQSFPSNAFNDKRALSVEGIQSVVDRTKDLVKKSIPIELVPTGFALVPYGSSAGIHLIFNFPHHHGLPNMQHNHNIKMPDLDLGATAEEVRGKNFTSTLTTGGPANPTENGATRVLEAAKETAASAVKFAIEAWSLIQRIF